MNYWIPYLFTAILNVFLAIHILKHKIARGAISLFILVFSIAMCSLIEALLWMGFSLEIRMILCYIQYIFIVQIPVFFLTFALEYKGIPKSFRWTRFPFLFIIPVLTIMSAWTNPFHHLFYNQYLLVSSHGKEILSLSYGPLFKIWTVYAYALLTLSTIIFIRGYISATPLFKKQYGAILLGTLIPWISNALYIFKLLPLKNFDLTPLAYTVTAICLIWAFYSRRLFNLQPIARGEVFNKMSDAVLILDNQNCIIDFNPAAQKIMEFLSEDLIGEEVSGLWEVELASRILMEETEQQALHFKKDGKDNCYDLRISYLTDHKNRNMGRILSFRDITKQKELEKQLECYATTDPLTGILNRRHFKKMAQIEIHRCIRYKCPLTLCMIDIDFFKTVNDNFGHETGDRVIKELVRICQLNLREIDLFSRWGGEEFIVLLPETDLNSAVEVAERLRSSIEQIAVKTTTDLNTKTVAITASIGIVGLNNSVSALEEAVKNVDMAMYHAKNNGRNCCAVMDPQGNFNIKD